MQNLLGYALRRASAAMMESLLVRLAPFDLRSTDISSLLMIEANPGITQSALCRALGIQRANMAPLAARLEARSLIQRQKVDGRSHGLFLTDEGSELLGKAKAVIDHHDRELAARLPEGSRAMFLDALNALWRA